MLLLIPGPVATHPDVRAAMAQDFAPWDRDFCALYARVRERMRVLAGGTAQHIALPVPGSGHYGIEAAVRSFIPPGGRILVPMTGSYAERMVRLAREAGRVVVELPASLVEPVAPEAVAAALAADPAISHVGLVYSETSSGVVHDAAAVGAAVRAAGRRMILDAVSAFGALPIDLSGQPEIDAMVCTANKCLEGLPGLAFVVARADRLEAAPGLAGSWSLDLADIAANARRAHPGSARFTPPAQVIAALDVALDRLAQEGGPAKRLARYAANMRVIHDGAATLGLTACLSRTAQGPIVVNILAPADPAWNLQHFVDALKARGVLISNFYNTKEPSFRVGCIGAITPAQMRGALDAMGAALRDIGIRRTRAA